MSFFQQVIQTAADASKGEVNSIQMYCLHNPRPKTIEIVTMETADSGLTKGRCSLGYRVFDLTFRIHTKAIAIAIGQCNSIKYDIKPEQYTHLIVIVEQCAYFYAYNE